MIKKRLNWTIGDQPPNGSGTACPAVLSCWSGNPTKALKWGSVRLTFYVGLGCQTRERSPRNTGFNGELMTQRSVLLELTCTTNPTQMHFFLLSFSYTGFFIFIIFKTPRDLYPDPCKMKNLAHNCPSFISLTSLEEATQWLCFCLPCSHGGFEANLIRKRYLALLTKRVKHEFINTSKFYCKT